MLSLKRLFLFFLLSFFSNYLLAQKDSDYAIEWKKVQALESQGLTKSALNKVNYIYQLAASAKNDAQQIKSCMYQLRYRSVLYDEVDEKNILFVDTLISKATAPAKNILQSMQAEMYWQYLQNNRWKLYNRTALADEKAKDIATWSLDKLHAVIGALYQSSLHNEALLQITALDKFEPIIIKGGNSQHLRPTLYDFLAHRALEYFMHDERNITRPADYFTIKDSAAFLPASRFVVSVFKTNDTASLQYKALLLMQDILKFHLEDTSPDALLDADLIRLNFVFSKSVNSDKDKLFEAALINVVQRFQANGGVAQAMYLRAKLHYDRSVDKGDIADADILPVFTLKQAKAICEAAIKQFPKSEGSINCQNLLQQITQPYLEIETEQVNIPGQPFRSLVTYKNATKLFLRVIKTSAAEVKALNRRSYDNQWKEIVKLPSNKKWDIDIPNPGDYRQHATEIKIDGLPAGMYWLLASLDENFSLQQNIIARQVVHVSNISCIHNTSGNYYVLNRETGVPLEGATIQAWERKYDYQKGDYNELKAENYQTDKNGLFQIKQTKDYKAISLQVRYKNDELHLDTYVDNRIYNSYIETVKPITYLFTDRSLYRPGQTLYFKGIVFKKNEKATQATVIPAFKTLVQLKDANGQKVGEIAVTTNEYGSYHGAFTLPAAVLNGQFSVYDTTANAYQFFNVEEYKRPKFSAEIQKPSGTYRAFDTITVKGVATAYAGNAIDGAKVKYRVVRKVQYPIWWYGGIAIRKGTRIMPYGSQEQVEITNGETVTDASGGFTLQFAALPDETVHKKNQPVFHYEVSADVTDLNGETRSATTTVAVAYQALQLDIVAPDKIHTDSLKSLRVHSANLNGIFEKTAITIQVYQLQQPSKIFRERYWQQPDQFVLTQAEYYTLFPHDVYKDEDKVHNWKLLEKEIEVNDSTDEAAPVYLRVHKGLPQGKFMPGWYKFIVSAKDKYGEIVKAEKYIQVFDNSTTGNQFAPVVVQTNTAKAFPGEQISYNIQTGFKSVWMIHSIARMDSNTTVQYPTIQAVQSYKNTILVTDSDRGGIAIYYAFVQHNRVYSGTEIIEVPWNNKTLNISYQTFRDKILPGAQEKWTVKISGDKGDKMSAELLAAMYDASLDQFKTHNWYRIGIWPTLSNLLRWDGEGFAAVRSELYNKTYKEVIVYHKVYDRLGAWKDSPWMYEEYVVGRSNRKYMRLSKSTAPAATPGEMLAGKVAGVHAESDDLNYFRGDKFEEYRIDENKRQRDSLGQVQKNANQNTDIQLRKNFNETAFFFPDLKTDAEGNISFGVTMPEALTQWKLMTLAHTKDLASGYIEKTLVTQKLLMVQPNAPRFMREGDRMIFSAKIVNLSEAALTGFSTLELFDAATNQPVDGLFKNSTPSQPFTIAAGQGAAVQFSIEVPLNFNSALTYRIIARANEFSDGEEMALPVLSNRMLVTESMPLNMRTAGVKQFKFDKLLQSAKSTTSSNHELTVEFTANPAWYAVQALPYLMEYPYDCAEQTFNRYYANMLAAYISNSTPAIKAVFEKWKTADTTALLSNLEKNEELKSALLQETPWVLDAQNEALQKKNITLLFDMVRMSKEARQNLDKLKEMQVPSGGFVWFKGGPDDRYITQYIVSGIGHLYKLNAVQDMAIRDAMLAIAKKALPWLDKKMKEEYDYLLKHKIDLNKNNLGYTTIQYLYMRSFFKEIPVAVTAQKAYNYYASQAKRYWLSQDKYMQGMIALTLHRNGDAITPKAIIKSLKENAVLHDEMGMYWKQNTQRVGWQHSRWFWHQAPIETQALLLEAFTDIDKNSSNINAMKTWLLKQKQTQNWRTTKATAEACYALLINPPGLRNGEAGSLLQEEKTVTIQLGSMQISSTAAEAEAGTGYFKKRIEGNLVHPAMGNIEVALQLEATKIASTGGWGAVYWQYFEDLNKITPSATPLQLKKQLYVERSSTKGPVLEALADGAILKVGDKVKVRIEIRVDRDMEYVHLKDMRAACMEPVNVLSGYKWQGGLGYYESTKDASTNFFFNWLAKGTYVFEYPLLVTHAGHFSNGITSIQCMYAPEFSSHSEGVLVQVEP
ncbi:MAG TPA: MG2 domain-containing protein [Ferruginibacter sp.]|nr:MG2 domain-containing protein [Ferruginibacter sp.]HMP21373.1 MG2 domain-containing protein [Ferruginibacter sp.]